MTCRGTWLAHDELERVTITSYCYYYYYCYCCCFFILFFYLFILSLSLLLLFIVCKILTSMLMAIASQGLHGGCQGLPRHQLIQREIPVHHILPACRACASCITTLVAGNDSLMPWWLLDNVARITYTHNIYICTHSTHANLYVYVHTTYPTTYTMPIYACQCSRQWQQ